MAIPDGPISAINFLTLRGGTTIEQFEAFSSEVDQPICLKQDVVESFEVFAVRHRGPNAPAFDVVEVMTFRDWHEWERVQDSHPSMESVMADFDRLVDGAGSRRLYVTPILPRARQDG